MCISDDDDEGVTILEDWVREREDRDEREHKTACCVLCSVFAALVILIAMLAVSMPIQYIVIRSIDRDLDVGPLTFGQLSMLRQMPVMGCRFWTEIGYMETVQNSPLETLHECDALCATNTGAHLQCGPSNARLFPATVFRGKNLTDDACPAGETRTGLQIRQTLHDRIGIVLHEFRKI